MFKPIKLAINGFGRIGRTFFRQAFNHPDIEIVAVNDLGDPENLTYLLKNDSVYGAYNENIEEVEFIQQKDPSKLPWKDLKVDIVVEATGIFDSREAAAAHIKAGAKRVVITAPAKDAATPTATPGVGEEFLKNSEITSNASCTTNAATPIMAVLAQNPGIKKAILNTIHAYTASQSLIDGPAKGDFRRARAAAQNIVPSTTGAALAATRAYPALKDKFDGIALRVPVVCGSIIDFTFIAGRQTSVSEINSILKEAATKKEWREILTVTEEPLVSSDIIGNPHGSIVDLSMTKVVDGDLVKILSWYDNEWGYASTLLKHVLAAGRLL